MMLKMAPSSSTTISTAKERSPYPKHDLYPLPSLLATVFLFSLGYKFLYDFFTLNYELSKKYQSSLSATGSLYETWLTPITGRLMDIKDPQWHDFRENVPILGSVFVLIALVNRFVLGNKSRKAKLRFGAGISLVFGLVLHRSQILFPLALTVINYFLVKAAQGAKTSTTTIRLIAWGFNCGIYLLYKIKGNVTGDWFQIKSGPFQELSSTNAMLSWLSTYNLTLLRLLSFAEDGITKRSKFNSLADAIYYVFYPALYVSGPIITFKEFVEQVDPSEETRKKINGLLPSYALRTCIDFLCYEIWSSYLYVVGITLMVRKGQLQLPMSTIQDLRVAVFWSFAALIGTWFRFLCIWRFARLNALLDCKDPPEDMKRCVANNYSIRGFWKDWHCSYNAWLVRYIYIPIGGSQAGVFTQSFASLTVFLFVALWHDVEITMVIWGLGFGVFLAPEIIANIWSSSSKTALWLQRDHGYMWMGLVAVGGALTIIELEIFNMVGYTLEGATWLLAKGFMEIEGSFWFLAEWFGWMWVGTVYMQYTRNRERAILADTSKNTKAS